MRRFTLSWLLLAGVLSCGATAEERSAQQATTPPADGQQTSPAPIRKDPADITSHGLTGDDTQAAETLSLFSTYLGRLAGDLALIFMARGGVYLAGGISQKIIPALKQGEFRAAFEDKAPHSALLSTIPTYVVTHSQAALAGLATFARSPENYGLTLEGRRWVV